MSIYISFFKFNLSKYDHRTLIKNDIYPVELIGDYNNDYKTFGLKELFSGI